MICPALTASGCENILILMLFNQMEISKLQLAIELDETMFYQSTETLGVFVTEAARDAEEVVHTQVGERVIIHLPEESVDNVDLTKGIYLLYDPQTDKFYRLRKLTPRECSRLMGNLDADTDKIEAAPICKSKQYQLYGNSIVVDCLAGIFKNLIFGCEKPADCLF